MGRFDALTKLEESKEKKILSPVVSSSTPIKPLAHPILKQNEVVKKPENLKSRKPENWLGKKAVKTNNNTVIPRHHDTMASLNQDNTIETIRKAVKHLGKEAATYRFTQEEKMALSDIVYTYKGQGVRTSENEITRIAINFLVEDYKENGK